MNEHQRKFLRETAAAGVLPGDVSGFDTRDIGEGLGDYLLSRCGLPGDGHPVGELMAARLASLRAIAEAFDPLRGARQTGHPEERLTRGLNTGDFGVALAEGATALARSAYDQQEKIARLMLPLPVRDFKAVSFPTLDVGDLDASEVPEGGEIDAAVDLTMSAALEATALKSTPFIVRIGRRLLTGDGVAAVRLLTQGIARAARRAEAVSLAALLEDTSNLVDGSPFFDSTIGNLVGSGSGAAPSVATLNVGTAALWDLAGAPARYLITPPTLETTCRVLAASVAVPGTDAPLEVVTLPGLSSTTAWYLACDPMVAPSVGLLTLEGSRTSFALSPLMRLKNSDDFGTRVTIDFKTVRLARNIFRNAGA